MVWLVKKMSLYKVIRQTLDFSYNLNGCPRNIELVALQAFIKFKFLTLLLLIVNFLYVSYIELNLKYTNNIFWLGLQEVFTGSKYKFKQENDTYQLIITTPKVEDTGKYTIEIGGVSSTAFLNVEEADPTYTFTKPLKKKMEGFTRHETTLECAVSSSMANVHWFKDNKKIESDDPRFLISKDINGNLKLIIKESVLDDSGQYRCQLDKQPDKTECGLKVVEYPYKFVKVLKSQQCIEKDTITLACEIDDAQGDVQWFRNDEEIKPDKRIQIIKDGRKRKLVIKDCKVTDAGQFKCTTNADKTDAELIINCN